MMRTRIAALAGLLLVAVICGGGCRSSPGPTAGKKEPPALPTKFTIKGTLVRADGQPITETTVIVHKFTPKGHSIEIEIEVGEKGVLKNPSGKTDAKGHFEIQVDHSFLPKDRRIMLSMEGISELRDEKGIPIAFEVDRQTKELDLDKIAGRIVVKE